MSVLFDYNWRLCDKVNLFTGVGAGCLMPADSWNALGYNYGTTRHYYPVAFPRVGIELFDQLRLSMEYRITKIRYGYFWVDIGYVFGGRIQKY